MITIVYPICEPEDDPESSLSISSHQLLDAELDELRDWSPEEESEKPLDDGWGGGSNKEPLDVSDEPSSEEDGALEEMYDDGRDDELPELLLGDGLPELLELEDDDGVADEELLLAGFNDELELLDELLLDGSGSDELDEPREDDPSELEDGNGDEGELEESLEDELDDGRLEDEPEKLELDDELSGLLEELEQHSQQQQPAWWLNVHGPSSRVNDPPERQMETARVYTFSLSDSQRTSVS